MSIKLCIVGAHGTGKTTICKKVLINQYIEIFNNGYDKEDFDIYGGTDNIISNTNLIADCGGVSFIPEQFREIIKDLPDFSKQTEEITLATYARQLYLENLYTAQGKNILCDRSLLDTFIYYDYFNQKYPQKNLLDIISDSEIENINYFNSFHYKLASINQMLKYEKYYSKIYLIEPSEREIENDNFRLTDKKEQLEIHKLFLSYFKDFSNVIIVNQEKQDEIVEMIIEDLR